MAILQTFEMQPGEIKGWPISFAKYLAATNQSALELNPIEYQVPAGITLVGAFWVAEGGYIKFFVSNPLSRRTYKLTFWLHTSGGERLEADVKVKVKDY